MPVLVHQDSQPKSLRLLFEIAVPALLLTVLALNPPHALDAWISSFFYSDGTWAAGNHGLWDLILHSGAKFATTSILLLIASVTLADALMRRKGEGFLSNSARSRALYVFLAAGVSFALVWWLKKTTGVACPWSTDLFGGRFPMTDPVLSLSAKPGTCWPSGHAGTGFALYGLYFAVRSFRHPNAGRKVFWTVTIFGLVCGLSRIPQGAHFLSHVVATMLLDWIAAGSIYVLCFSETSRRFRAAVGSIFRKSDVRVSMSEPAPSSSRRFPHHIVALVFVTALWWTAVFNHAFITLTAETAAMRTALSIGIFSLCSALLFLMSLLPNAVFKTSLLLLNLIGAGAFIGHALYGVIPTPDMMRNIFATDAHEASGYWSVRTVGYYLLAAIPPIAAACFIKTKGKAAGGWLLRSGCTLMALVVGIAAFAAQMQPLSGRMRADKSLRYLIAPVSVIWSSGITFAKDSDPGSIKERVIVDPNAKLVLPLSITQSPQTQKKPLLVFVVGETTRAANWGLSGYERPTTEPLNKFVESENFINFPKVAACGTSTDVSLPCMMSRVGRSDYDRRKILSEESLPGLLQRAGARVAWIDNQSGCKGTCDAVPTLKLEKREPGDGALVAALKEEAAKPDEDKFTVVFLHMMGAHGPAYYQRSADSKKVFLPECRDADLSGCSKESIRNAYDNSVLETADVLANLIDELQKEAAAGRPTALLYVSDHGESLGEKGLYLHGAPYMLAPSEQTEVPMIVWVSDPYKKAYNIDMNAFRASAQRGGVSHDHLWSTVLGLVGVDSTTYTQALDLGKMPEARSSK